MNKVIDKGFRSCRFVSTIVKHPVSVKQMFRTWMKILLHCGFGYTQVNQMTYEPMHSAQAQSVRVKEKNIFWVCWSPFLQHYKKLG